MTAILGERKNNVVEELLVIRTKILYNKEGIKKEDGIENIRGGFVSDKPAEGDEDSSGDK